MRTEQGLENQQRDAGERKNGPHVKIEQEIFEIESPWFGPENVGTFAGAAKDVIGHNVPWNKGELTVEYAVNQDHNRLPIN